MNYTCNLGNRPPVPAFSLKDIFLLTMCCFINQIFPLPRDLRIPPFSNTFHSLTKRIKIKFISVNSWVPLSGFVHVKEFMLSAFSFASFPNCFIIYNESEWLNQFMESILFTDKKNELLRHTQTGRVSGKLCCVEKASLKRLYNVWSHSYDILEMTKL